MEGLGDMGASPSCYAVACSAGTCRSNSSLKNRLPRADWRETDHGGKDQQARTADHPGLEKPLAREKQDMGEGSGGVRHAHDLAAVRPANRAGVNDPEGQRNKQEGGAP